MAKFEVTTDLIIHCHVTVTVEADDAEGAIDRAAELMPQNSDRDSQKGWKAAVELKTPKGVIVAGIKPYHYEQASGVDKAKKVSK